VAESCENEIAIKLLYSEEILSGEEKITVFSHKSAAYSRKTIRNISSVWE